MMKKLILAFCMLQGILLSLGAQDMHQNIAYADNNVRFYGYLRWNTPFRVCSGWQICR